MKKEIYNFLRKAREENGYETGRPTILSDGSEELSFKNGLWKYRDRWSGSKNFFGSEEILYSEEIVWINTYGGGCPDDLDVLGTDHHQVFEFLKKALCANKEPTAVRGEPFFTDVKFPGWEYFNREWKTSPKFEFRLGEEIIMYNKIIVHVCNYQVGFPDT